MLNKIEVAPSIDVSTTSKTLLQNLNMLSILENTKAVLPTKTISVYRGSRTIFPSKSPVLMFLREKAANGIAKICELKLILILSLIFLGRNTSFLTTFLLNNNMLKVER